MKIIYSFFISALLSLVVMPASGANLASSFSNGQYVLLMRHADAPGYGDPIGYRLDQCSTQRNLGDRGKKQAVLIGQWLTNQGVSSAQVISSPWCRCIDTAKLLNKGQVIVAPALGLFL